MTETREFNAATVEEAIRKASKTLGLLEEDLSYEVLDTGSAGFLGMGSRDARIAVETEIDRVPETEDFTEEVDQEPEAVQEKTDPEERDNGLVDSLSQRVQDEAASPPATEKHPEATNELLDATRRFISTTVESMGFDARIDVYDAGEFVAVDVTTNEPGLFIGQKGETIDALQYLLNIAIYKDLPYAKRIAIDSEGYRQRRVEAVQGIAHRMARKAVRERRLVELPPMNTSERRIVHLFLKDNPQVTTTSQGTGDNRRVTVAPSR